MTTRNMQVIELKDVIGFTRMQASSFDIWELKLWGYSEW